MQASALLAVRETQKFLIFRVWKINFPHSLGVWKMSFLHSLACGKQFSAPLVVWKILQKLSKLVENAGKQLPLHTIACSSFRDDLLLGNFDAADAEGPK